MTEFNFRKYLFINAFLICYKVYLIRTDFTQQRVFTNIDSNSKGLMDLADSWAIDVTQKMEQDFDGRVKIEDLSEEHIEIITDKFNRHVHEVVSRYARAGAEKFKRSDPIISDSLNDPVFKQFMKRGQTLTREIKWAEQAPQAEDMGKLIIRIDYAN